MLSKEDLMAFEERVKEAFLAKLIRAPIHLSSETQAQPLIDLFKNVQPQDWVFSTHRSHFHALLKGVSAHWLWQEILAGRSMSLMNQEHRFFCSAIIAGALPIACGVAAGIKLRGGTEKVWTFVGDMASRSGLFHEFYSYCCGHELPVHIVVEDNKFSTNTPTETVWGRGFKIDFDYYRYERKCPHVGVGQHVTF